MAPGRLSQNEQEGVTAIGYTNIMVRGWNWMSKYWKEKREGFCNCKLLWQLDMHMVPTLY